VSGAENPRVIGLDLSLTSTGVAGADWTRRLKTPDALRGHARLDWVLEEVDGLTAAADLVVVEGPSFGSTGPGQHERGGLWWMATGRLRRGGRPYAVVPPSSLKLYATGKGSAGKDDVLREITKRFPWFSGGNDEADALGLVAMGRDRLGFPLVDMPKLNRAALAKLAWPNLDALAGRAS
jgi:hypothetical protein